MNKENELDILIPVFNENETIVTTIKNIKSAVAKVIVVESVAVAVESVKVIVPDHSPISDISPSAVESVAVELVSTVQSLLSNEVIDIPLEIIE